MPQLVPGPAVTSTTDSLNIAQIRAFLAIVDTKSFQGAASKLSCAQPTVSQLLRKLEEALGASLIRRGNAESVPTAAGERLLPIARGLLRAEARAREAVSNKSLAVGASSNIGIYLLPQRLAAVRETLSFPVDVQISSNPEIARRLESGEIDLAIMEWWDDRPGFKAVDWAQERLVFIVPKGHEWASRKKIKAKDLLGLELLGGENGSGTGSLLREAFGPDASQIKAGRNLGSTEAVKRAVMAGLGVSIVLESSVSEEASFGSLVVLDIEDIRLFKTLKIVIPEGLPHSAPAQRFSTSLAF